MNIDLVMKEHHIPQNKDTPLYALYKREKRRKKVILSVRFSCDIFRKINVYTLHQRLRSHRLANRKIHHLVIIDSR